MAAKPGQTMKTKKGEKVTWQWLLRSHMDELVKIDKLHFASPWKREKFERHRRHRQCIGVVAEAEGKAIAFCICQLQEKRICIRNIGVHPNYIRQGIGEQFIQRLQAKLSEGRWSKLVAFLPRSRRKNQPFFEKYGIKILMPERLKK